MFSRIFKTTTAILLLLALSCSFFACSATPSESSFREAYDNKIEALIDDIDDYYQLAEERNADDMKIDADLSFNLSNDLLTLLRSTSAYDLSWINDASISISENFKGDLMSLALGLSYGNTDVVSADVILDMVKGKLFMSIPAINDKFVEQDMEGFDGFSALNSINVANILPDQDALENIINKLYGIIMNSIGTVEFRDKDLVVNGIVQTCVEYEIKLSQKEFAAVVVAAFEMLKVDSDFKALYIDITDKVNAAMASVSLSEDVVSGEEAYAELVEEIDDLLATMKSITTLTDETMIAWTSFITDDLELIGAKIDLTEAKNGNTTTIYIATARDDDDRVGRNVYINDAGTKLFEIKGDLEDTGKKLSGTYEIKLNGQSMAFIDLSDVDVKKLEDKYFVGSLSISPSKGLINLITSEAGADISMAGLSLASLSVKIDVEKNDGKALKATLSVMSGSTPYASISIDSEISDGKTITTPSNANTNFENWIANSNFNELLENVSDSGLPSYISELLYALAFQMQ